MTQQSPPPTIEDLNSQLAEARENIAAAERAVGVAALDGKGEAAPRKALEGARAEKDRLLAALEVAEDRAEVADASAADDAARRERIALYRSLRDALPAMADVARARAALTAAEAAKDALRIHRRARILLLNGSERVRIDGESTQRLLDETELDQPLLRGFPRLDTKAEKLPTPARCAELMARADELIEAEEAGKGEDVTLTGPQFRAQRAEQRQRRREENQRVRAEAAAAAKAEAEAAAKAAAKRETKAERRARVEAEERKAAARAVDMQLAGERARGERI